ncbi:MAG: VWA domain-containing protein [Proteobacteria bacterium]|nr:VWA domain-containing protein [Pseudomonadota bacterium]
MQTKFMSADDSNSQADAALVRQLLLDHGVVASSAKPWEFLNYYDFAYDRAEAGTVSIVPQMAEIPDEPGAYEMLIAVASPAMPAGDRPPMNLVFSLDTSCSMGGNGIDMLRASVAAITNSLQAGDVVSMVNWSNTPSVILDAHEVVGPGDPTLTDLADSLDNDGGTNLDAGLEAAYELAEANFAEGRTNRVVLISDGGANLGATSADLIAEHAIAGEGDSIYLVGIGTPNALNYNHELMDELTDLGRGAYFYIDSAAEAEERFAADRLPSAFELAALDVQLAVTLPPGFVVDEFRGEEIGDTPSEVTPQHLAPNDQMLYSLDLLDCSADADSIDHELTFVVEWTHPATGAAMVDSLTVSVAELLAGPRAELDKASTLVAYAQAFEAMGPLTNAERGAHLDAIIEQATSASVTLSGDPDLDEVLAILGTWRAMYP